MREIRALFRAAWLTETSYRLNMILSVMSLLVMIIPLYFISGALQETMAARISSQSERYFAFVLLGATIYTFVSACTSALPNALATAIARGTLETYLGTRTSVGVLFAGMSAYSIAWALVRAVVMVAGGVALGVRPHWSGLPTVALILALLVLSYGAFGLVGAALLIRYRTTGPLLNAVLGSSALLGGVYYPTHVMPSWLPAISRALPLTYGLRAARQAVLLGEPLRVVGPDVIMLALFVTALMPIGILCVSLALRYARRSGTLSHY